MCVLVSVLKIVGQAKSYIYLLRKGKNFKVPMIDGFIKIQLFQVATFRIVFKTLQKRIHLKLIKTQPLKVCEMNVMVSRLVIR